MKRLLTCSLSILALSLSISRPATAQVVCPNPCTIDVGKSFSFAADHDGVNTTGYRVYLDGVKTGPDLLVSALQAGAITVTLTAPARGSHALQLAAFNLDQETKSAPLTLVTRSPAPTAPTNLRITIVAQIARDGSVSFKIVDVTEQPQQ